MFKFFLLNKKYFISFFNIIKLFSKFFYYEISNLLYDYVIINYIISLYIKIL